MHRLSSLESVLAELPLPAGVRCRLLARADLPVMIAALAEWHPDIVVGDDNRLIKPAFYEARAAFSGEDDDIGARPVSGVLLHEGSDLAGLIVLEHDAADRSLAGLMSAVSPRQRGRGLGRALIRAQEIVARTVGARVTHGLAELDNMAQCAILEGEGWRLCGIVPESTVRTVADGMRKYVPEAIYLKVLVTPEELIPPNPDDLLPRTAILLGMIGSPASAAAASFGSSSPPPIPEIDPSLAALLQARPGGAGTWPDIAIVARQLDLPPGFLVRQMRRDDIPRVIPLLAAWHPDVVHGAVADLMDASFYLDTVALACEELRVAERPTAVCVVEKDREIVGIGCYSYDIDRDALRDELTAVDVRRRGHGIGAQLDRLSVLLARAIGAETVVGWTTLRHRGSQVASERGGLRLWGLIPASERFGVGAGVVKSGYEALYGVSLVPAEQSRWPELASLPPHRAAWVRFVRGEASGGAS